MNSELLYEVIHVLCVQYMWMSVESVPCDVNG